MCTADKPTDIIIADNQYLVIEALKNILGEQYLVKAIVNCRNDLVNALQDVTSGFLIMDYSLIDFDGFNDLKEIRNIYPSRAI